MNIRRGNASAEARAPLRRKMTFVTFQIVLLRAISRLANVRVRGIAKGPFNLIMCVAARIAYDLASIKTQAQCPVNLNIVGAAHRRFEI
jgi:hypothetical protein